MELSAPRRRTAAALCAGLVVTFAVVLRIRPGGAFATEVFDDLGEAIAALLGAVPCIWRAIRSTGRRWRLSWALLGAGLGSWSIGQFCWSYYELVSADQVPFPSWADAGFLLFPAFCLAALFVRPSAAFVGRARLRVLLDATMIVASLFILSWSSALGAVSHAGAQNWFGFAVSLAYPAGDIVLIAVAVLVASRARLDTGLVLLVGGLISMAVADSAFAYLVAAGTYGTGAFTDVAWVAAFLAIGASAFFPVADEAANSAERVDGFSVIVLPYLLLVAGIAAMFISIMRNVDTPMTFGVETAAILALLLRQLIVVLDNRRLTLDVMAQKVELTHRAFHDPLTGLANRALFYDRLAHALDLHRRDLRPVSVVFVDLDDFKSVNDAFGHDAGDAVLTEVAHRLGTVVRTGDTVARLGGDEFAILVEDERDPIGVAERILEALSAPVRIGDRLAPARASIGTTTLDPGRDSCDSQELLRQADVAMYSAKRAGKGTSVSYVPGLGAAEEDLKRRCALRDDLAAGLVNTELVAVRATATDEVFAFEAVPHWAYHGIELAPADLVAVADTGNQLGELCLHVAERAITAARSADEDAPVIVRANMGLARMAELEVPRRVGELIARFRLRPGQLVIAVGEQDASSADIGLLSVLDGLRDAGAGLAIDRFGVGYSNLARLEALQPDLVQLDRSLVAPLLDVPARMSLLRRIIELAHDLGAVVVAEGVDTEPLRSALAELGCDAVRGALNAAHASHAAEVA